MSFDFEELAEYGFDTDESDIDRLSAAANRYVGDVPTEAVDRTGLEDEYVIKLEEPVNESNVRFHQNQRETRVYLESQVRGQDFLAPVICGSTDFSWIVSRKLNEIKPEPTRRPGRRGNREFRQNTSQDYFDSIVPEEWTDIDESAEFGYDKERLKVMDAGQFQLEDEWNIGEEDILENDYTDVRRTADGSEYFVIEEHI